MNAMDRPTIEAKDRTIKAKIAKMGKLNVNPLGNSKFLFSQLVNEIIKQTPTTNIMPPITIDSKINQLEGEIFWRLLISRLVIVGYLRLLGIVLIDYYYIIEK
jgi:hypothetical protein